MGTRNLTMVISNNQTKVAQYGQWDGYPSGQGATALDLLTKIVKEGELSKFKENVDKLTWFTDEQIEKINADVDWSEKYPYLSRDWGAQILEAVHYGTLTKEPGFMRSKKLVNTCEILGLVDNSKFAADSLFCEWAYVIDLDKNTFEVYEGFNKEPLANDERFASMPTYDDKYKPVKFVKSFDLNALPELQQFLEECEPKNEEDEENEN